jgi:type II secretory ATPase GspE/PulE/Tfp pilus assembly ATPase PilB-like protein
MPMTSVQALRETRPNVPLVERMIAAGLISERQLQRAMQEKARRDRPLGEILVELGMISERVLSESLGQLLGDEAVNLRELVPDPRALAMLPRDVAERYPIFPIEYDERADLLTLAATGALDPDAVDEIARSLPADIGIATAFAADADIKSAIRKFYDIALTIADILRELDSGEKDGLPFVTDVAGYTNPLNRLVDAILFEAARCDASAVHFEPEFGFLRVRFRIDGVLTQVMVLHHDDWPGIAARLTAMCETTDDEARGYSAAWRPFMLGTQPKAMQLTRQSTLQGHDFVVRIVPRDEPVMPLQQLGLDKEALAKLRLMMARPGGLIVIAGPPGSGKTRTLHSMLGYRSDESLSILTLDDRPCSSLPWVCHTRLGEGADSDDAAWFESLHCQNPDVLTVDEVRDRRTAHIAWRAAASGRQVFATLSAPSAMASLVTLQDFGMHTEHIAGITVGIIAQRLVRKLCANCKQAYSPQPFERQILGADESSVLRLYREGACEQCNYLGYKGRTGVFEILVIDATLDELRARGAALHEMHCAALAAGSARIAAGAIRHVLSGETSLSEASRVVDLSTTLG